MGWELLVGLIIKEGIERGLPLAAAIIEKWSSGNPPTLADIEDLRRLASLNAADHVKARLLANGIPLDDPRALEILKLLQ